MGYRMKIIRCARALCTVGLVLSLSACGTGAGASPAAIEPTESTGSASEMPHAGVSSDSTPTRAESSDQPDTLGTYRQLFAEPALAQCMSEIMGQHVDDQLTRKAAEGMTGIGGIGNITVRNGRFVPAEDTENPHCAAALQHVTSIAGIEHFTNIQTLCLDGLINLRDLTPVRGLRQLMSIRLLDTAVTDFSQLNSPTRIYNLDVFISAGMPTPTIAQQRAWRINIITQAP